MVSSITIKGTQAFQIAQRFTELLAFYHLTEKLFVIDRNFPFSNKILFQVQRALGVKNNLYDNMPRETNQENGVFQSENYRMSLLNHIRPSERLILVDRCVEIKQKQNPLLKMM